jgi:hypothetical protein
MSDLTHEQIQKEIDHIVDRPNYIYLKLLAKISYGCCTGEPTKSDHDEACRRGVKILHRITPSSLVLKGLGGCLS